ncbi:MAG TPA: DUF366 family protein [Armatimonadota bacterium]|nr:DUF366 family protein [Armatimonadota bacterium]
MVLTHFAEEEIAYTGAELRSGWLRATFGLKGDAIAAFVGPCDVAPEHMVDLEDLAAGAAIRSRRMLHFIAEHAGADLERAVLRQRLLVIIAAECLQARIAGAAAGGLAFPAEGGWATGDLQRRGDDLFWQGRKLSVSIATTSPASGLIHLGLNVIAAGAPVPAAALCELGAEPRALAQAVIAAYATELAAVAAAQRKVRPVE